MKITPQLRQRFCKDCKLAIGIYEEPYFSDRLQLFDNMYHSIDKWNQFLKGLEAFDTEQQYFEYYNGIKDALIDHVKASKGYIQFNAEDMNKFRITNTGLPATDIFKPTNSRRMYVSIDMRQANFSALNYYSSEIFTVNGKPSNSWEDFVSKFTDNAHIISSKYIRQVVLGNCNPKRHISFEKWIMDRVVSEVSSLGIGTIASYAADELVLDVTDCEFNQSDLNSIKSILDHHSVPFSVQHFMLLQLLEGNEEAYAKIPSPLTAGDTELKCVPAHLMPFILRTLNCEEITDNDMTFIYQGSLARYLDSPLTLMEGCEIRVR